MSDRLVTYPKARKAHTCDHCGHPIRPGTTYARVVQFPTAYRVREYDGEYDVIDVPFGVLRAHDPDGYCVMEAS